MTTRSLWVLVCMLCAASLGCAGTIDSFDIQLGSWNGSTFFTDGSEWNTFNPGNWAVGATEPGFGNPVLDGFSSVALADGEYFLYMATDGDTGANAIQITLGYSGSNSVVEVFTDPSGAASLGTYILVAGAGFAANLVSGPQTGYTTVGSQQVYHSTGEANWAIDLNSGTSAPEPASWTLLAFGSALIVTKKFLKKLRQNAARTNRLV